MSCFGRKFLTLNKIDIRKKNKLFNFINVREESVVNQHNLFRKM